jgi:hypothetical protein
MSPMMMRFFTLIGIALAAASMQMRARADVLPDTDVRQVRAVVEAQLKAFAEDDADKAFEMSTPAVQKLVGNSNRFLALVAGNYPMVYRSAGIGFLTPEKDAGQVLQMVALRDADGKTWLALFALEQQPDKSWRIGGCIVAENDWRST